jgi:hypothetical protein
LGDTGEPDRLQVVGVFEMVDGGVAGHDVACSKSVGEPLTLLPVKLFLSFDHNALAAVGSLSVRQSRVP